MSERYEISDINSILALRDTGKITRCLRDLASSLSRHVRADKLLGVETTLKRPLTWIDDGEANTSIRYEGTDMEFRAGSEDWVNSSV